MLLPERTVPLLLFPELLPLRTRLPLLLRVLLPERAVLLLLLPELLLLRTRLILLLRELLSERTPDRVELPVRVDVRVTDWVARSRSVERKSERVLDRRLRDTEA